VDTKKAPVNRFYVPQKVNDTSIKKNMNINISNGNTQKKKTPYYTPPKPTIPMNLITNPKNLGRTMTTGVIQQDQKYEKKNLGRTSSTGVILPKQIIEETFNPKMEKEDKPIKQTKNEIKVITNTEKKPKGKVIYTPPKISNFGSIPTKDESTPPIKVDKYTPPKKRRKIYTSKKRRKI